MPMTSQIITISTVVALLGLTSYAIYFDYTRRTDPQFRKKLRKEKKRIDRSNASVSTEKGYPSPAELDAALQALRTEEVPSTPDEKEAYFMQNLAIGEQLTSQGLTLPAALSFFRAMRVYPEPLQLVTILQKTLPEPTFRIVTELMSRDVKHKVDVYYDYFPPKYMNVKVDLVPVGEINGVKSALKRTVLVAARDFKAGETIYKEKPIVACLDADLMGTDSYCAYCLRAITPDTAIHTPTDPFQASYCSTECKSRAEEEYESLLFAGIPLSTPANPNPSRTKAEVEERKRAQEAYASLIKETGRTASVLIIRFIGQLLADEHARLVRKEMKYDLPSVDKEESGGLVYAFYDYIERLRGLEITPGGLGEEEELVHCRRLLKLAVDGLEEFLDEEKFLTLKGKIAYNGFGVCYGTGRTTRPPPKGSPEAFERTRTPIGTHHQIGTAFYRVSSYLNHSCSPSTRPVFEGTSELYLVANHDIKAGDQITISYVDTKKRSKDKNALDARKHRRLELARGWGFACDCSRCKEEETTLHIDPEQEVPVHEAKLEPAVARYLHEE